MNYSSHDVNESAIMIQYKTPSPFLSFSVGFVSIHRAAEELQHPSGGGRGRVGGAQRARDHIAPCWSHPQPQLQKLTQRARSRPCQSDPAENWAWGRRGRDWGRKRGREREGYRKRCRWRTEGDFSSAETKWRWTPSWKYDGNWCLKKRNDERKEGLNLMKTVNMSRSY